MAFFLRLLMRTCFTLAKPSARCMPLRSFLEPLVVELAGNLHVVNFLDAVAWVRDSVGELAVVRDEDQPFVDMSSRPMQ